MTSGLTPEFRESWMERLSSQLPDFPNRPLTHIAFPGSHDSGTATVNGDSPLSDSCPATVRFFAEVPFIGRHCVKPFVAKWSRTQSSIIAEQVQQGIRYVLHTYRYPGRQTDKQTEYSIASGIHTYCRCVKVFTQLALIKACRVRNR